MKGPDPRKASPEEEELRQVVRRLSDKVAGLEAELRVLQPSAGVMADGGRRLRPPEEASRRTTGRPLRALILDALDDLSWPTYSRELALYCKARYGREIPSERFGTLGKDEVDAFRARDTGRARTRTVWLCFALTCDRHEAIKRLWARSDWPLERRIVGPLTSRVQHLKLTAKLCELALRAEETAAVPEMMMIIAADHARDLPGIRFQRGRFDLEDWRDTALKLLEEVEPKDEDIRGESAERLRGRREFHQLFGVPDVVESTAPPVEAVRIQR